MPGPGRPPGEGHGNPLQYTCLENLKDTGAWRATAHGVTGGRDLVTEHHDTEAHKLCASPWVSHVSHQAPGRGDTSQREVAAPQGPFGRSLVAVLWTEARGLGRLSHCGWKTQWLPSLTDCKGLERREAKKPTPDGRAGRTPPVGPGGAGSPHPAQPPQRSPGPSPQGLFHVNAGFASFFFSFFPSLCCYHFKNK